MSFLEYRKYHELEVNEIAFHFTIEYLKRNETKWTNFTNCIFESVKQFNNEMTEKSKEN